MCEPCFRLIGARYAGKAFSGFTAPAPVGGKRKSDSEGFPLTVDRCGPPAGGDGQHHTCSVGVRLVGKAFFIFTAPAPVGGKRRSDGDGVSSYSRPMRTARRR